MELQEARGQLWMGITWESPYYQYYGRGPIELDGLIHWIGNYRPDADIQFSFGRAQKRQRKQVQGKSLLPSQWVHPQYRFPKTTCSQVCFWNATLTFLSSQGRILAKEAGCVVSVSLYNCRPEGETCPKPTKVHSRSHLRGMRGLEMSGWWWALSRVFGRKLQIYFGLWKFPLHWLRHWETYLKSPPWFSARHLLMDQWLSRLPTTFLHQRPGFQVCEAPSGLLDSTGWEWGGISQVLWVEEGLRDGGQRWVLQGLQAFTTAETKSTFREI